MNELSIRFIANSGVFIEYKGRKIILDGIYGNNLFFTPPLKEMKKAVFGMQSVYKDADYLIFTHRHVDHFNAAFADEYALNNQIQALYVPSAGEDPDSYLEDRGNLKKAANKGVLHEIPWVDSFEEVLFEDCKLRYIKTVHLDEKSYRAVNHFSVLLSFGDKNALFAADSDVVAWNKEKFAALGHMDAVFVTPLFLNHPNGRHMMEEMNPGKVVIYHLPFEEHDATKLLDMVKKQTAETYSFPLEAFTVYDQSLEI